MPLAILVVISSVISLGYYLKLIKIMWFDEPAERLDPVDVSVMGVVLLSAVIAGVVFMVFISELGTGGWATIAASGLLR
jgi:NADH-quinone oxidoreductase subunit N